MNTLSKSAIAFTCLMIVCTFLGSACTQKKAVAGPVDDAGQEAPIQSSDNRVEEAVSDNTVVNPSESDLETEKVREAKLTEERLHTEKSAAEKVRFTNEVVLFDFDSSLLSDRAKEQLKEKAAWMADNPDPVVTIEGHCDLRGTEFYNAALGKRRAEAAKTYLSSLGIVPQRITCISMGEEIPVSTGQTEEDHQKNRRVQFRIDPTPAS